MALDVDQVLEHIGSFFSTLCYLGFFVSGFQTMLMTFIATEPGWRCMTNSSLCNVTGIFRPGDAGYNDRCEKRLPRSEWEYEDSFTSSVTEWDLICDKSILGSVYSSVIFDGWLLGVVFLGWLSDKFGRREVMYFSCCLAAVFGFAGGFSSLFWLFVSARFIVGFMLGGASVCQFVLATEIVGLRHRHSSGIICFFAWTLSLMTIPLFAFFIRDWRLLNTVLSALGLPSVFVWWFINAMVYFGVSLSAPVLGGNIYLNFFLISALEIPANYVAIFSNKKFGRKKTVIVPMILAALASMGAVLLTKNNGDTGFLVGRIIMALTAKFFITVSFDAIYVFSAELFPTVVRNTGVGTSSGAGRIGSFCSSYIIWLTRVHPLLPYGIMGVGAFVAALLCITLPETKDQSTAEVVGDTGSDVIIKESKSDEDEEENTEFTSKL